MTTSVRTDRIPAELRTRRQWVRWRPEQRNGKTTKVLGRPVRGQWLPASSIDPDTWGTFENAMAAAAEDGRIGFVFDDADPYVGVDLDDCRNPETGHLEQNAAAIILRLDSYTEASPSGAGVHVILKGRIQGDRRRNGRVEMYHAARFFTITGVHIPGTPETVEERQAELDQLYTDVFPPRPAPVASPSTGVAAIADDGELLDRAMAAANGDRFAALWAGSWEGMYQSQSEADAALCSMLAFWTDGDAARVDELFRQSGSIAPSGLGRTTARKPSH